MLLPPLVGLHPAETSAHTTDWRCLDHYTHSTYIRVAFKHIHKEGSQALLTLLAQLARCKVECLRPCLRNPHKEPFTDQKPSGMIPSPHSFDPLHLRPSWPFSTDVKKCGGSIGDTLQSRIGTYIPTNDFHERRSCSDGDATLLWKRPGPTANGNALSSSGDTSHPFGL
jgi:hypothetical protein